MYSFFVQYNIIKEAKSSGLNIDTHLQGRINGELCGSIINYTDIVLLVNQFITIFFQKAKAHFHNYILLINTVIKKNQGKFSF